MRYEAKAELGGKLAAVGSRVIQGISKKMADDFFGKFACHFSAEEEKIPTKTATETAPQKTAPSPIQVSGKSELPGTVRDLIWLSVGIAVGIAITWAY